MPRKPNPPRVQLLGIDENTQTSNQEAVPVPLAFGQVVIAAKWISPIYNEFAVEAPANSAGKK